jgi:hypothetical protein
LLSAFVAGLVYSRIGYARGVDSMRTAFWRRVVKVYLCQAAILLFLFTVIAALGLHIDQPAVKNLVSYYLAEPRDGFLFGLLLIYEPALLDILPMYIFFMLMSPWVLAFAMRHGWTLVMVASVAVWAAAQFGISEWIYGLAVHYLHVPVPFHEMGAFNTYAWQFLWFAGLCIGATRSGPQARPLRFPWWLLALAAGIALYGVYWRHTGINGQAPFGGDVELNLLFDKWQLGPLRLVNLVALGILAVRFGPWADAPDSAAALAGGDGLGVAAGVLRAPGGGAAGAGLLRRQPDRAAVVGRRAPAAGGVRGDVRRGAVHARGGRAAAGGRCAFEPGAGLAVATSPFGT